MSAPRRHPLIFVLLTRLRYWVPLLLICVCSCGGGSPEPFSTPSASAASALDVLSCASSQCVTLPSTPDCAAGSNPDVSCYSRVAFWYEPLAQGPALSRLAGSQVVVGVSPDGVSAVHSINARALAYVTYYQSSAPGQYISSTADLPAVGFLDNGQFAPSMLDPGWYVLCPNSVELRHRVAVQLNSLLNQGYDGLFVDNTFLAPPAGMACQANHAHVTPGQRGDDSFLHLLGEVRAALEPSVARAVLISNPGNPVWADQLGTGQTTLWDLSDFVLWESYGFSSDLNQHDNWQNTLAESWKYAADPARATKIIALSYPTNMHEALFSFALARMFGFRWAANLGVSGGSGHYGEFTSSMPFSVGVPQGSLYKSGRVLARRFSNGIAYANTGLSPVSIAIPDGGQLITDTGLQSVAGNYTLLLAPSQAAILVTH